MENVCFQNVEQCVEMENVFFWHQLNYKNKRRNKNDREKKRKEKKKRRPNSLADASGPTEILSAAAARAWSAVIWHIACFAEKWPCIQLLIIICQIDEDSTPLDEVEIKRQSHLLPFFQHKL